MDIKATTAKILEILNHRTVDGAHTPDHVIRVQRVALHIAEKEGGNKQVLAVAALVHDEHRVMEKEQGKLVHPKESLGRVKEILAEAQVDPALIPQILHCVENHELWYGKYMGSPDHHIDVQILQDADALDGLGAIGIGRSLVYGAHTNRPMYDETIPLGEPSPDGRDPTFIHHMHKKYLNERLRCNTKTAQQMAKHRYEFMQQFYDEFLAEWQGRK